MARDVKANLGRGANRHCANLRHCLKESRQVGEIRQAAEFIMGTRNGNQLKVGIGRQGRDVLVARDLAKTNQRDLSGRHEWVF
jgi:hypothetical protein